MIPGVVVFAEVGSGMEHYVYTFKVVSELRYVPDVPYDDTSGGVAKLSPRFFFGPGQRPHLMAGLKKNTDQIVSQEPGASRNKCAHDSSVSKCRPFVANHFNTAA